MKKFRIIFILPLLLVVFGFLIPQDLRMPVENATSADYNKHSFWYYPWGRSVTHKGVDVFAKNGTPIRSATRGFVLAAEEIGLGGNFVLVLGPKWRLHYYAHLEEINTSPLSLVSHETIIGTVGASGNAAGKPPHLHYSIVTIIPYVFRMDSDRQGWKKMFFLNPIDYL